MKKFKVCFIDTGESTQIVYADNELQAAEIYLQNFDHHDDPTQFDHIDVLCWEIDHSEKLINRSYKIRVDITTKIIYEGFYI